MVKWVGDELKNLGSQTMEDGKVLPLPPVLMWEQKDTVGL